MVVEASSEETPAIPAILSHGRYGGSIPKDCLRIWRWSGEPFGDPTDSFADVCCVVSVVTSTTYINFLVVPMG